MMARIQRAQNWFTSQANRASDRRVVTVFMVWAVWLGCPPLSQEANHAVAISLLGTSSVSAQERLARTVSISSSAIAATTTAAAEPQQKKYDAGSDPTLAERLADASEETRLNALVEASALGPLAADLVPAIVKLLDDPSIVVKTEATIALGAIGSRPDLIVPALQPLLSSEEPPLREFVLDTLAQLGPAAVDAAPAIASLLKAKDVAVRCAAAAAYLAVTGESAAEHDVCCHILGDALEQTSDVMVPTWAHSLARSGQMGQAQLRAVLSSPTAKKKSIALNALMELGPEALPSTEELIALSQSTDPALRSDVAMALAAQATPASLQAVLALVTDADLHVRAAAVSAVAKFPPTPSTVDALIAGLSDREMPVKMAAIDGLGRSGRAATKAVNDLMSLWKDPSGAVTIRAADALVGIGAASVPALITALQDPHYCLLATQTLGRLGPLAAPAVPTLVQLLNDQSPPGPRELCLTLGAIGPSARPALDSLRKLSQAEKAPGRAAAIYALGRLKDHSAVPQLLEALSSEDERVPLAAAWSLLEIKGHQPDLLEQLLPHLIEGLDHPDHRVVDALCQGLEPLGSAAASALPELVEQMNSERPLPVRANAARAVVALDATGDVAVPALMSWLQTEEPRLRRMALYGLGKQGSLAKAALPAIEREWQSGPFANRALAAWAALRIDPTPGRKEQYLPDVLQAASREAPQALIEIARLLGDVGTGRHDVQEALRALADSPIPAVRATARAALTDWQ
jgi:HEAT repeat protein